MSDINDLLRQTKTASQQDTLHELIQPQQKWKPSKRSRTDDPTIKNSDAVEISIAQTTAASDAFQRQQTRQANVEMCHRLLRFVLRRGEGGGAQRSELEHIISECRLSQASVEMNVSFDIPDEEERAIQRFTAVAHPTIVSHRKRMNVVNDVWPERMSRKQEPSTLSLSSDKKDEDLLALLS